jgi:uncharacterized protein involved in outer membrane biogenesis
VQTTLLGLAIALILALLAALAAPLVVDWNHYRGAIEREASRLTGLDVRVGGPIDARLLPTPTVTLRDVDVGAPGRGPQVRAGTVKLELALGPLLRGQFEASQADVIAPRIALALDRSGALQLPSFRLRPLSISHLSVEDGSITLTDAQSGTRLALRKFWFDGDIGPYAGSFGGDGAAIVGDALYAYRITGSPAEKGGGIGIRFGVDPADRPLTTQFDGTLTFPRGVPHFDGTLAVARPVGAILANGRHVVSTPWRATGTLKATPALASFASVAFRYGPDERAVDLTGSAELTLGAHPQLAAKIAALQVDVDRALAAPKLTNRPPLVAVRSFLQAFAAEAALPIPAQIGFHIDALTIGGAALESMRGGLHFDRSGWTLDDFQFHTPGMTEVKVSGKLSGGASAFRFSGPIAVGSADAGMLLAWLDGDGGARPTGQIETLNARGQITIASDRMAVDGLTATLDRENVSGRLGYSWPVANRPARLDAELKAADLDVDGFVTFAKGAFGKGGFVLPEEATLALAADKASYAGVQVRAVDAKIKFDAGTLQIDRLSVGDLGGAKLAVSGRIDAVSSQPRGELTLDLDTGALGGLSKIIGKFAPQEAGLLRDAADHIAPAQLHAALDFKPAASSSSSTADLHVSGNLATMRLHVDGTAAGAPSHWAASKVNLSGRIDADDGTALIALLGLGHIVAVDQLPGRLTLTAAGPLDGDVRIDGQAAASGLDARIGGTLHLGGRSRPSGTFQIAAAAGDLRPLQQMLTGQPGAAVAVSGRAALAVNGSTLSFTGIAAKIGKAALHGRVALDLTNPLGIDGAVDADRADAGTVMALLLGLPSKSETAGASWSKQKIAAGAFAAMNGAVNFKIDHAQLTPTLPASDLKGVIHFRPSAIAFDGIDGRFAGGRLTGALAFHRSAEGLAAHALINLVGASAATILGPSLNVSGGELSATLQSDGSGLSPVGLIGSLHGTQSFVLKDAQFAGLDLAAFAAAIKSAGTSAPVDFAKVEAAVNGALANGHVEVAQGGAALGVASGTVDLNRVVLQAKGGGELALDGFVDLANASINARTTLSQPPPDGLIAVRPAIAVGIKGSLAAPQRTLDLSSLTSWLALRSAELQTRRIEAFEAEREQGPVAQYGHPAPPDIRPPEPGSIVESALPPNLMTPPPGTSDVEPLQPQPAPAVPPAQKPSSAGGKGAAASAAGPIALRPRVSPPSTRAAPQATAPAMPQ